MQGSIHCGELQLMKLQKGKIIDEKMLKRGGGILWQSWFVAEQDT